MDKNTDYYEQYVSELNSLYTTNSDAAKRAIKRSLKRLNVIEKEPVDLDKVDTVFAVIISVLMVPLGFLSFQDTYFFGLIFFIAGVMVGIFVPYFGLIFLFSHGLTGLSLMLGENVKEIYNSPLVSDGANVQMYMYVAFGLFIAGFATVILKNFIKPLKEFPYIKTVIMLLLFMGVLLIKAFPYVVNKLV